MKTTKWLKLGLKLGVEQFDLDVIENNRQLDAEGALAAVLKKWLEITEEPTWKAVVDALRAIKEMQLAKKVETRP